MNIPPTHTVTFPKVFQSTKMGVYNFHIFDGSGNCCFSLNPPSRADTMKIVYGFIYSLKSLSQRITPTIAKDNNFFYYSTSRYHLVFYEFPTSLKFVLIISVDVVRNADFYRDLCVQVYQKVYVEYHVKCPVPIQQISMISSPLFREKLVTLLDTAYLPISSLKI